MTSVADLKMHLRDGYVGTATITAGNSSIVVAHRFGLVTPKIMCTPKHAVGMNYYVDTVTTSAFTIHLDAPQASDVDFDWQVV